jgi:hypothetical protein
MAQIIKFFSNQAVFGAVGVNLYSEIFNVESFVQLAVQFRLHMSNGGTAQAVLETCMDPALDSEAWTDIGSTMSLSSIPSSNYQLLTAFKRFIRARVSHASAQSALISLCGVARSTS